MLFEGKNLLELTPDVGRAKALHGVSISHRSPAFRTRIPAFGLQRKAKHIGAEGAGFPWGIQDLLKEKAKIVEMEASFMTRSVNEGFSGAEKTQRDLQMRCSIRRAFGVDETDSGLDIDALRIVAEGGTAHDPNKP